MKIIIIKNIKFTGEKIFIIKNIKKCLESMFFDEKEGGFRSLKRSYKKFKKKNDLFYNDNAR